MIGLLHATERDCFVTFLGKFLAMTSLRALGAKARQSVFEVIQLFIKFVV